MRYSKPALLIAMMWLMPAAATAQQSIPPPPSPASLPTKPAPIQKLSDTTYRMGQLRIDVGRRELVAPGTLNDVTLLEFVANTKGGFKAYESAITIDSDAISFNAALLLLGLDVAKASVPSRQFDPGTPKGDPVEIFVSWTVGGNERRVRIEELLFDQRAGKTVAEGPWVYTGSTFFGNGGERYYMAEMDGVLIGGMHHPSAIIDNPRNDTVDGYGSIVMNPKLGVPAGTAVTVTIRASGPAPQR